MKLSPYLKEQGLTLAAFGKKIGRTKQAVARYVSGKRVPDHATMGRIVAATGGKVSPNDFYAAPRRKAA